MTPSRTGRTAVRLVGRGACALLCGAAMLAAVPAHAQSSPSLSLPPLSLDDAVRRALAADPAAPAIAARLDAARAMARQADVRPNPVVSLEVENFTGSNRYAALERTETTIAYAQTIERGGKQAARTTVAEREIDAVGARARIRQLDLAKAVQLAWIDAMAAEAEVQVADQRMKIARGAEREVSRRVAAARDPLFAGARAEAESAEAEIALETARSHARDSRAALAAYWGGTAADIELAVAPFEDVSRPEGLADGAETPDIAALAAERDGAVAKVALEERRAVQDPTVSVGIRHLQEDGAFAVVVGASIPLARYDTNRGAIDSARAQRLAAEADIAALKVETQRQIAQLIARRAATASAVRRIDAEVIHPSERAVVLVREGFNRGGFSYLDVIAAQRALIEARTRRIDLLKSFHQDGAALDRLTGAHAPLTASAETRR